ncbi:MAG: hypothetical protein QXS02_03630 [Candidatus Thermoplasmatota archaeon]
MYLENVVLSAGITVFSAGLLIISLLSYYRYKNIKLLFVSSVFFIFLIKGILLSLGLFIKDINTYITDIVESILDISILILLFIATLKR